MKIKKLEICGFKSFVDKTTVHFPDPITAIVGPNGCGKSNIVDAIRWCMGEQSAKHLRGRAMDDVIFAGSESRGPAGMAEVSLTFDTTTLPALTAPGGVPWGEAQPAEVMITRRLYRDGTSEYLLGGVLCRLRDIVDFFLGTGVGTKAYSIIEQGRVGFIVSSKPEDRRTLIDEAAGITKYKAKKRQAERRMESTRQHLLRVSDVIGEIDSRLRSLRLAAQKAERYKKYKSELKELELWDASHRYLWHLADEKSSKYAHGNVRVDHEEKVRSLAIEETEIETGRLTLADDMAELSSLREMILELSNQAQLENQRAHHYEEESQRLARQSSDAQQESAELEQRLTANRAAIDDLEQHLSAFLGESEAADARYRDEESLYNQIRDQLSVVRRESDEAAAQANEARTKIAREESELAGIEASRADLAVRLESLAEETARVEQILFRVREEMDASEIALQTALAEVEAASVAGTEARRQVDSYKQEIGRASIEVETLREEAHRRRSRLESLREIETRYESFERGVGAIMRQAANDSVPNGGATWTRPGSIRGPVADIVSSPAEFETAVEAVLGRRLGSIVVESHEVGVEAVSYLKQQSEGRSSFIPLELRSSFGGAPIPTPGGEVLYDSGAGGLAASSATAASSMVWPGLQAPGVRGNLLELVGYDRQYDKVAAYLLGDVVVVDTIENALALWKQERPQVTLVTLDGETIDPQGVITGGSPSEARAGILSQKREIRELESLVANVEGELEKASTRHVDLKQKLVDAENWRSESEEARRQADMKRLGLQKDLDGSRRQSNETEGRLSHFRKNAVDLQTSDEHRVARAGVISENLAVARIRVEDLQETSTAKREESLALAVSLDAMVSRLTELKVAAAQAGERRANAELTLDRTRREINEQQDRIARLTQGGREQGERAEQLTSDAIVLRQTASEKLAQAEAHSREHAERQDSVEERSGVQAEREEALRSLRSQVSSLAESASSLQLRLKEAEFRRISLEESVAERYRDTSLAHVVFDYHLRAPVTQVETERMEQLRGLIERMGEINLTAIEESEELQKRFDFLTTQKADLESAMEQLETAITKINRASRRRFQEVFDAINAKFQEVFPRLFRGGNARLVLTNPDDLLETGVDIVANPPGKKMQQNLELLSGGEKALTAVSLLFAIFLVKPSPFCILDEVDAPLDDINVTRYAQGIREMTERSQFIVITHNKQSMEIADRLCGVTMEEPGVSKLVAVQMRGDSRGSATIETLEMPSAPPAAQA
jgi:chromosome segregation protein